MDEVTSFFSAKGLLPHGFCMLWRPDILALHAVSDLLIAAAYFTIPLAILSFVRRRGDLIAEHKRIALLFSTFILGCGVTHIMGVVVLWRPLYVADGLIKAFTAGVSVITAFALWPGIPRLLALPSVGQLSASNDSLRREIAAKDQAVAELNATRASLEAEVERPTADVRALARRFEIATAESPVTVSEQDHQLRYTWLHNPRAPLTDGALGLTDGEAMTADAAAVLAPLKRRALDQGERLRAEVALPTGEGDRHFQMTLTPVQTDGGRKGLLVAAVDITELKRLQQRQSVIARELAHRAKNILALIEGVARQSVRAENLPEAVIIRFSNRLAALGRAQDLLVVADWAGIELGALVRAQLAPLLPDAPERIRLEGPKVTLSAETGQYLALAFHELATNALKYGVLTQGDGRLAVRWGLERGADGEAMVQIEWIETGAPVTPPQRRGFGRLLLDTILPRALGARASLVFDDEGVAWRIVFNQALSPRSE